jgi:sodium/hydrogen antiporter
MNIGLPDAATVTVLASEVQEHGTSEGMLLLLLFAGMLVVGVLLSGLAHRTVLSTAVLFLVGGFLLGDGGFGVVSLSTDDPLVFNLAELALFAVLFSDGMRVGWKDINKAWHLPGRALLTGMPLTMIIAAAFAYYLTPLDFWESMLLGAILAPTDPVFAAALVGNTKVPYRLRHLLNVESGVNDGLALPFVLVFLALAAGRDDLDLLTLAEELIVGVVIGIVVPFIVIKLERTRFFEAHTSYTALNVVAIGVLVFALGKFTHGNLFLAAFAAGMVVASIGEREKHAFHEFGELVAELLKLAALLVFGMLISLDFLFAEIPWTGWVFAILAIVVSRPLGLAISMVGSSLPFGEKAAAAWFGPKGFASVVYGLLVLSSDLDPTAKSIVFHLVVLTVTLSIIAHSSTDIVVAKILEPKDDPTAVPADADLDLNMPEESPGPEAKT